VVFILFPAGKEGLNAESAPSLNSLLPQLENWKKTEQPSNYFPENLFEYINGAAEIYLAYDFKELAVGQYGQEGSEVNVSVEIYEMSNETNAFGIYSAERFTDSTFIPVGVQGYVEEGMLNFLVGKFYVKLLCFEGGERSEEYLSLFAQTIADKSKGKTNFPELLQSFPQKGLIANSERFIQKNVMGYSFLHDGYMASYRIDGMAFDGFIIQGQSEEEAQSMMDKYLNAKEELPIQKIADGIWIKDRYYHNIFLARVDNFLCGVMKIRDSQENTGKEFLEELKNSLKK
jgi:hypothetical protein